MTLLDGKYVAQLYKSKIKEAASLLPRKPHLAVVLVGNNGASRTYVESKVRSCEEVGFRSTLIELPDTISQTELLDVLAGLNQDSELDGFIVQSPLPAHLDEKAITLAIDPEKDVDGFHPVSVGKMALGLDTYLPATPLGILLMLETYQIQTEGKRCVILGRSHIVGSPMSILLSRNAYPGNCTVTLVHSKTLDLIHFCREADILIAALGKPNFVKADMVKSGAVVIDVGITRVEDPSRKSGFAIKGDVDFEGVAPLCSFITPVPGGVGLTTVVALLLNTLKAAEKKLR
jgi:methylenetetrahydrofolate dehydrogenase (NADP+)/methenyltetrahydrofolate cyclohydrolase